MPACHAGAPARPPSGRPRPDSALRSGPPNRPYGVRVPLSHPALRRISAVRSANPAGPRAERMVVELLASRSCGARHHVSLL
jgi:hypothetical protein